MEAVSVDYIPWLTLIQEKHQALRALRYGDPEPWKRYLQERECRFWDPEERPLVGKVILSTTLKKNRDGLTGRHARFFALDRQQGSLARGELPHWWLVIRDAMPSGDSALVWEGKCLTDEDAIAVLDEHECIRRHGVADSGDDTTAVYQFCLRYGINAIKGNPQDFFAHRVLDGMGREVTVQKIYSPEKPLHAMIGAPPSQENDLDEPQFWHYSKKGIADRLHWLRAGGAVKWDVPSDVSDDYQKHMEAEEQETIIHAKDGRRETIWRQHSDRNDLLVCERYISMLMEMAGLIGDAVLQKQ